MQIIHRFLESCTRCLSTDLDNEYHFLRSATTILAAVSPWAWQDTSVPGGPCQITDMGDSNCSALEDANSKLERGQYCVQACHRIFKLMVKSQAGRFVHSAETEQSTPRWQRAPLTIAQGSIKKSLANSAAVGWAGISGACWFADSLVTHLKLLSFKTKVPLWLVLRLSTVLPNKSAQNSLQTNLMTSKCSPSLGLF